MRSYVSHSVYDDWSCCPCCCCCFLFCSDWYLYFCVLFTDWKKTSIDSVSDSCNNLTPTILSRGRTFFFLYLNSFKLVAFYRSCLHTFRLLYFNQYQFLLQSNQSSTHFQCTFLRRVFSTFDGDQFSEKPCWRNPYCLFIGVLFQIYVKCRIRGPLTNLNTAHDPFLILC